MPQKSLVPNLTVAQVIKLFTTVPHDFVDDFFSLYDRNKITQDEFLINLEILSKWINVPKISLMKTLRESYTLDRDYVIKKGLKPENASNRYQTVLITPETMKRLCMRSQSVKSETVRTYFIEIEEFMSHYNEEIVDGLMRNINEDARRNIAEKRNDGPGTVYILRASKEMKDINKIGQTGLEMSKRLRAYNTGRAEDIEVLSVYKVQYRKEVELCVKKLMVGKRYRRRREVYHVDHEIISKLIAGCAQMSMKLHFATRKSRMDGEYYIIFTSDMT